MDEPVRHYAKWNTPGMENLMWFHSYLELKRVELTETEHRMPAARTEGWPGSAGKGELLVKGCDIPVRHAECFLPRSQPGDYS